VIRLGKGGARFAAVAEATRCCQNVAFHISPRWHKAPCLTMDSTIVHRSLSRAARIGAAFRVSMAVMALRAIVGFVAFACGGTNGHEDLPVQQQQDANEDLAVDASDATTGDDEDASLTFDVAIFYADQTLPEVNPPSATADAAEAGYPWPTCPPFIPERSGDLVALGRESVQIPSDFAADGSAIPAMDGSACATYGWLGSTAADECETATAPKASLDYIQFPPCNWCVDAGTAVQGPGAAEPRYSLCLELYECIMASGCGGNVISCLCGSETDPTVCASDPHPPGPCATDELASLEQTSATILDAINNYEDNDPTVMGFCGSRLNQVFNVAQQNDCLDGGP